MMVVDNKKSDSWKIVSDADLSLFNIGKTNNSNYPRSGSE
jgi:hypothetical protein